MTAVIKFSKPIKKPTRATKQSVGLDFYAPESIRILPRNSATINLGFSIQAPLQHYTLLKERSSLALKNLICLGGVIDPDFRGDVIFILHNLSDKAYVVQKGEKIGQMLFFRSVFPKVFTIKMFSTEKNNQMSEIKYLREERGKNGFGSSNEEGENKN